MQTAPRKAQRNTRQRALVMEIVRGSTAHPTATAVYEEARKRLPRISLGTVYRILRVLQEEGRVQDVAEARASARFDARTDRHPHLICLGCGRIADFDLDLPPALAEPARQTCRTCGRAYRPKDRTLGRTRTRSIHAWTGASAGSSSMPSRPRTIRRGANDASASENSRPTRKSCVPRRSRR